MNKIIPGVWSSYFYDMTPEEMVRAFLSAGWHFSEISNEHSAVVMERGKPFEEGEKFRKYASDLGMSFPQGHLWLTCDIAAIPQEPVIEKLKEWLDLFAGFGVKRAVLHPGGKQMQDEGKSTGEILEANAAALRQLCGHIKGTDMTICLENLFTRYTTCEDLLGLIEAAGTAQLGICLDTGHLNIAGGSQSEFIKKAGKYLKALHIADNEGKSDQHMMPYGKGKVDWADVTGAIKEIGYEGLFNFEIPGERHCPLPVMMAKLDFLKAMSAHMLA